MKKLNVFFFGNEEIHVSDAVWFYGGCTLFVAITLFYSFISKTAINSLDWVDGREKLSSRKKTIERREKPNMIKISVVDAYQGMDETDFSVMDDETHLCFDSDQRGGRKQSRQFYLDNEGNIILEIYWDDEKVHTVAFENKAELTERGKMRLVEQKRDAVSKSEGEN